MKNKEGVQIYYSHTELNNFSEETSIEYIDRVLHLNDLQLSKTILETKIDESKNISEKCQMTLMI